MGPVAAACSTRRQSTRSRLTVGNFDHRTDQIHSSSSRGPVTYGGSTYIKPEISAPGVSINSSIRDGSYGTLTGTSMSAPHVAGAAALLLSAAPGYSGHVDAIENLLLSSTEPMTTTEGCGGDGPDDVPNNTWGWGILDALNAVGSATAGTIEGTVSDANTESPIAGAEITAMLVPGPAGPTSTTGANGQYSTTLALNTYDITVWAEGYFQQTAHQCGGHRRGSNASGLCPAAGPAPLPSTDLQRLVTKGFWPARPGL